MRPMVLILLLLAPVPALAGAWPREQGRWFVSGSVQMTRTGDGRQGWAATYVEYGATPRLTLGLDAGHAISSSLEDPGWQGLVFGRYDLAPEGPVRIGAGLGAGVTDDGPGADPVLKANLALGRGFEARFGMGWAEVEVQALRSGGGTAWKLDATVGVSPRKDRSLFIQAQMSRFRGADTQLRLVPTLVQQIGPARLEVGATLDAVPKGQVGLKLGLWREF